MSDKEIVLLIGVITFAGIVIWSLVNCGFEWVENHKKSSGKMVTDDSIKEFQDEWLRDAKIKALEGRLKDAENKLNRLESSVLDILNVQRSTLKKQKKLHEMIKRRG